MNIGEVESNSSFKTKNTQKIDATIAELVDSIRKDINSYGNARIDGQHSVLNLRGKVVARRLGIDLNFLSRQAENHAQRGWIDKYGDIYTIGYK